MSLIKAFNASIERGVVPQRPRANYKTLAQEAAEFANRDRIKDLEARTTRLEIRCQDIEKALKTPQNRSEMALKQPLMVKGYSATTKAKKGTQHK